MCERSDPFPKRRRDTRYCLSQYGSRGRLTFSLLFDIENHKGFGFRVLGPRV